MRIQLETSMFKWNETRWRAPFIIYHPAVFYNSVLYLKIVLYFLIGWQWRSSGV